MWRISLEKGLPLTSGQDGVVEGGDVEDEGGGEPECFRSGELCFCAGFLRIDRGLNEVS